MNRPRLTAKVIRGLWPCISLIDAILDSVIVENGEVTKGNDLIDDGSPVKDVDDTAAALKYLRRLAEWHERRSGHDNQ
jgi:hypothetical protein